MEKRKKRDFPETFDLQRMQRLQDAFTVLTGVTEVVVDPQGNYLTEPSNLNGICRLMRGSPKGHEKCVEINKVLWEEGRRTRKVAVGQCPHSGLTTAVVPIFQGNKLLGGLVVGQVRIADPSKDLLDKTAVELQLDRETLAETLQELPVMTRAEFDRIVIYLQAFGDSLEAMNRVGSSAQKDRIVLDETSEKLDVTVKMLRKFIDSTDARMYISDYYTGEILLVNRAYAEDVGKSPRELIGSTCWMIGGPGGDTFCSYCPREKLLNKNGKPGKAYRWENYNPVFKRWLRLTNQAITWTDGRLAHMVTYWDITEERKMRDELAHIAYYDRQMSLPNYEKLQKDIQGISSRKELYLIAFDLLQLRRLNEAYGRAVVDELLAAIVDWVEREYPEATLYRIEGDEFALLFGNTTEAKAAAAAKRIYKRFGRNWTLQVGDEEIRILCGASVSVVYVGGVHKDKDLMVLIERTVQAAKAHGGVVVHNEEMDRQAEEHAKLEMSLKTCVNSGMEGFSVHYQPIVDPAAGVWRGLEALCRWTSPELGPIAPPGVYPGGGAAGSDRPHWPVGAGDGRLPVP